MTGATQRVPILSGSKDITRCPTCGMAVRIERRSNGYADHYEPVSDYLELEKHLGEIDPETDAWLVKQREGKKTVALVGMAATSCSLAPFNHPEVELWALNEMHHYEWLTRATRWFQIHHTKFYTRDVAKRGIRGHYDWLKENAWDIPIYMQYWHEEIPKSVAYPLHDVLKLVFGNMLVGKKHIKNFYSTLDYMFGVAILEGRRGIEGEKKFDRIEIYGFEMGHDTEYVWQKASANFWIGYALALGIEIWMPENCQLLRNNLYGGNEQGEGW